MERHRHPDKELEKVLAEAEDKGWRVFRTGGYFKMYCPCVDKHKKTVHLSPSLRNYKKNLLAKLNRDTCWSDDERGKHALRD